MDRDEVKVLISLNDRLDWLIENPQIGAPLFGIRSGDVASPGISSLCSRIDALEQHFAVL